MIKTTDEQTQKQMHPAKIGQVIKMKRNERGMGQKELAELVSVTKGYVSQIERGNVTPRKVVKKLLKALDVNEEELMKEKECVELKQSFIHTFTSQLEEMPVEKVQDLLHFFRKHEEMIIKITEIEKKGKSTKKLMRFIDDYMDLLR